MLRIWRVGMKKNRTKLPNVFLGFITVVMYLPILIVIIYSFNESRISSVWEGFSLKWYGELFRDKFILEALINSIVLATLSSIAAAIIGTLGAVGMARVKLRSNSMIEYVSTLPIMIPEIILGIVFTILFFVRAALWYDNAGSCAYCILYSLCVYYG